MKTLLISSQKQIEMIDITSAVRQYVEMESTGKGIAIIYTPHTTAAITINENADPDVSQDILMEINKIVPMQDNYRHLEGNSAAHLKSTLFGVSETVIINAGELVLGTWQGIYFCEFDGPRQRKVHIQILSS